VDGGAVEVDGFPEKKRREEGVGVLEEEERFA
jgi:hypothetical protein